MTEQQFLIMFKETLGIEHEILPEEGLMDLEEWDSLGLVSFLAMADAQLQRSLSADIVKNAQCVKDLYLLLQE